MYGLVYQNVIDHGCLNSKLFSDDWQNITEIICSLVSNFCQNCLEENVLMYSNCQNRGGYYFSAYNMNKELFFQNLAFFTFFCKNNIQEAGTQ